MGNKQKQQKKYGDFKKSNNDVMMKFSMLNCMLLFKSNSEYFTQFSRLYKRILLRKYTFT